jgi:preprotein translocase SecE subunit
MEQNTIKKITLVSFLGLGAIAYIVTEVLFRSFASAFSVVQRLYSTDLAGHGIPIAVAVLLFSILFFNSKTNVWAEEVISEVSKVVWPSRKDTVGMTIVVCVMVFIASAILFLFDNLAQMFVKLIVQ